MGHACREHRRTLPVALQIELFFRWIKENLRLRSFYGTSPNAIRVQIWTAIRAYLATALARSNYKITTNLTTFLQVLSPHACSRVPLNQLFSNYHTSPPSFNRVLKKSEPV